MSLSQTLRLAALCALCSLANAAVNLGADWPASPLDQPAVQRRLSTASVATPPTGIGMYHVILWSSLGIAVTAWFAVLALFNMDVGHDSLLYSKAKMD
mmetsp:Transcript_8274/g.25746  ORF Transcript_8274/g.25746 Transcript_8274/m.25746 type:complete len:98 (-) Transcript_8274:592-885(-)